MFTRFVRQLPLTIRKRGFQRSIRFFATTSDKEVEEMERQFTALRLQSGLVDWSESPEHVLVVHPKIRWGQNADPFEDVRLKLEEASALVKTLPGFTVANCIVIGTDYTVRKKLIWGHGRLESVKEQQIQSGATSVMINIDVLSPIQQTALSGMFKVPVYDRYNLVLRIFKYYARTPEAKLQIALAEIPYIRSRMKHSEQSGASTEVLHIGDASAQLSSNKADRFEVLRFREHALRKKLRLAVETKTRELEQRRAMLQKNAKRSALVAVIGYTNAGKTTLIKTLTGAEGICGEDRLFATLDTTLHHAILPSRCGVFLADTIGFIADLPLNLISSFEATLRHVVNADLLIHIEDISHPDVESQRQNVMETLRGLNIREELLDSMIHIANKTDKLSAGEVEQLKNQESSGKRFFVSCRNGLGLKSLVDQIDKIVQISTGIKMRKFRLKPNSPIVTYLYSEGLVAEEPTAIEGDLLFCVSMSDQQLARLKARMSEMQKTIRRVEKRS
ncbi:hypothetical protein M3Y94_00204500 [Aphelenchoides besseyi]|nr:hypothetical protein M3Y94_00204500 [Aphelenchoides besseyi]